MQQIGFEMREWSTRKRNCIQELAEWHRQQAIAIQVKIINGDIAEEMKGDCTALCEIIAMLGQQYHS